MAKQYRKKPVIIEAVKWTGENVDEVLNHGNSGPAPSWGDDFKINTDAKTVEILTMEGTMSARIGDWIIRGIKGEFYPCKPDIFEATYEQVANE